MVRGATIRGTAVVRLASGSIPDGRDRRRSAFGLSVGSPGLNSLYSLFFFPFPRFFNFFNTNVLMLKNLGMGGNYELRIMNYQ